MCRSLLKKPKVKKTEIKVKSKKEHKKKVDTDTMTVTQKNRLRLSPDERDVIHKLVYHCTKLYNFGLYQVRQKFINEEEFLPYVKNYYICKENENYKLILSSSGQQTLRMIERNFRSFFNLLKKKKKGGYKMPVKIPKYKKEGKYSILVIQGQSARINKEKNTVTFGLTKGFKDKYEPKIDKLEFTIPKHINVEKFKELRIIPVHDCKDFDIEFVYSRKIIKQDLNFDKYLSIDLGLDNLAACFDASTGKTFLMDGKYLKGINHLYNKKNSKLQSVHNKEGKVEFTEEMSKKKRKRDFRINDYFNRVAKVIIDYCIKNKIGNVVIGDFEGIKQNINLGKVNNQNFVSIPHYKLKRKINSKAEMNGIKVHYIEESYTSKTSFLDQETPEKKEKYAGRRKFRGLMKTNIMSTQGTPLFVNADTNGAAQTLMKFLAKEKKLGLFKFDTIFKQFIKNPIRVNAIDYTLKGIGL